MRWLGLGLAILLLAGTPPAADGHALHTTLSRIEVVAGRPVQVWIRVFTDDLSHAVPSATRADGAAAVYRYAVSGFRATDRDGRPMGLRPCGIRHSGDLSWICLVAPTPSTAIVGGKVWNRMLFESFRDQVNIVQIKGARGDRVLLFTRGAAPKTVP